MAQGLREQAFQNARSSFSLWPWHPLIHPKLCFPGGGRRSLAPQRSSCWDGVGKAEMLEGGIGALEPGSQLRLRATTRMDLWNK